MKSKTSAKKFASIMISGLMVLTAGVAVASAPASAATACNSRLAENEQPGPNTFASRVACSTIDSDEKVRAKLEITGAPDIYSSWFTREDTVYGTLYVPCPLGCDDNYEITGR